MVRKQLFSFCRQYKVHCWPRSRAVLSKERNYRKESMTHVDYSMFLKIHIPTRMCEETVLFDTENMSAWSNCAQLPYLEYPYWSVTTLAPLQEGYFLKTWCSWKSSTSEAKSPTNTENSGLGEEKKTSQLRSSKQALFDHFK